MLKISLSHQHIIIAIICLEKEGFKLLQIILGVYGAVAIITAIAFSVVIFHIHYMKENEIPHCGRWIVSAILIGIFWLPTLIILEIYVRFIDKTK